MPSIPLPDMLTILYVLVDDWHQTQTVHHHRATPGRKPALRVRATVTILLAMDRVPLPSEQGFLAFLRANHPTLFPQLPALSHVNRHARAVRGMVEHIRQSWFKNWAVADERQRIRDTKPVPVVGYKRTQTRSDCASSATYGYCASRNMHYCGYKLVLLTTIAGLPVADDLVPAHTDERDAAMRVLSQGANCAMWADKGFLGEDWHDEVADHTGNRVWTPKRGNQKQNPPACDRLLGRVRERIEGTFNELQNTGRNLERMQAKTGLGMAIRVATNVTHHGLKYRVRHTYGIAILTVQVDHNRGFSFTQAVLSVNSHEVIKHNAAHPLGCAALC